MRLFLCVLLAVTQEKKPTLSLLQSQHSPCCNLLSSSCREQGGFSYACSISTCVCPSIQFSMLEKQLPFKSVHLAFPALIPGVGLISGRSSTQNQRSGGIPGPKEQTQLCKSGLDLSQLFFLISLLYTFYILLVLFGEFTAISLESS